MRGHLSVDNVVQSPSVPAKQHMREEEKGGRRGEGGGCSRNNSRKKTGSSMGHSVAMPVLSRQRQGDC